MDAPTCKRCGKAHWSGQECAGGGFLFKPRILKAKWGRKSEVVEEVVASHAVAFTDEQRADMGAFGFCAFKTFSDGRVERINPEDLFAKTEPEKPAEDPRKEARKVYQRELMRGPRGLAFEYEEA